MSITNRKIVSFLLNKTVDLIALMLRIGKIFLLFFTALFFLFSIIHLLVGGPWITTFFQAGAFLIISVVIEITLLLLREKLKPFLAAKITGEQK